MSSAPDTSTNLLNDCRYDSDGFPYYSDINPVIYLPKSQGLDTKAATFYLGGVLRTLGKSIDSRQRITALTQLGDYHRRFINPSLPTLRPHLENVSADSQLPLQELYRHIPEIPKFLEQRGIPLDLYELIYGHDSGKFSLLYSTLVAGTGKASIQQKLLHVQLGAADVDVCNYNSEAEKIIALCLTFHHWFAHENPYPDRIEHLGFLQNFTNEDVQMMFEMARNISLTRSYDDLKLLINTYKEIGPKQYIFIVGMTITKFISFVDCFSGLTEDNDNRPYRKDPISIERAISIIEDIHHFRGFGKYVLEAVFKIPKIATFFDQMRFTGYDQDELRSLEVGGIAAD